MKNFKTYFLRDQAKRYKMLGYVGLVYFTKRKREMHEKCLLRNLMCKDHLGVEALDGKLQLNGF
jgi:hypothetical protein